MNSAVQSLPGHNSLDRRAHDRRARGFTDVARPPDRGEELLSMAFLPHELRVDEMNIQLPDGLGCNWTTVGPVPDAPGLYAFTVEHDAQVSVTNVGMTEHLWMVTLGPDRERNRVADRTGDSSSSSQVGVSAGFVGRGRT